MEGEIASTSLSYLEEGSDTIRLIKRRKHYCEHASVCICQWPFVHRTSPLWCVCHAFSVLYVVVCSVIMCRCEEHWDAFLKHKLF